VAIPTFEEYLAILGHLSAHVDPTASTPEEVKIEELAAQLAGLPATTKPVLSEWVAAHPDAVPVLALALG